MYSFKYLFLLIGFAGLLLPSQLYAQKAPLALDPIKERSFLIVDNWTTDEGLPSNYLNKVCQTPEGYLWVTCYSGLVRYDGKDFHVFNQENSPGLTSNSLGDMLIAPDSTLWITTAGGGLVSFKNDSFKTHGLKQGFNKLFKAIYQDSKGRIWAGSTNKGWFYFQNDSFHVAFPPEQLPNHRLSCMIEDKEGRMWFGTEAHGLFLWENGALVSYGEKEGLFGSSIWSLSIDESGKLWVGTGKGLNYLTKDGFVSIPDLEGHTVSIMHRDFYNNFWIGTNKGLWVYTQQEKQFTEITEIEGDNKFVFDINSDHEGNLWFIRLKGGLSRIKKGKFINYSPSNGLASNVVNHITKYKSSYLVCFENGSINQIKGREISDFPTRTDLKGKQIKHLLEDSNGSLWISTYMGLVRIGADGKEKLFDLTTGFPSNLIRMVFEDSQGRIWIGTRDKGIIRWEEDGRHQIIDTQRGLNDDLILSISEGNNREILIGTSNGGLGILTEGREIKNYDKSNGFPSNVIFSTTADSKDGIWVATNAGISYMLEDKVRTFNTLSGLPTNNIYDIQEDDEGHLWMSSGLGVIKVSKAMLLASNDAKKDVYFRIYDSADGLQEPESNPTSKIFKAADGALWFPTVDGLAMIHPSKTLANAIKPPVYINQFITDTDTIIHQQKIMIGPENKRFKFDFAALYFYAPNKVRYKYQLVGFDKDWVKSSGQATNVSYTNLDAGKYTFKVVAANDEGVWNDVGDEMTFTVDGYFYESPWFAIAVILLLVSIIASVYQTRVNVLRREQENLERLVDERTNELKSRNAMLEHQQEEILAQRDEIEKQHIMVLKQQSEITASIQYAQRIQDALLPPSNALEKAGVDGFIFFKPRDIVSGDFFWVEQASDKIALVVADCTGHGVPGAFMSMLGLTFLNDIVVQRKELEPKNILETLRKEVKRALRQDSLDHGNSQDGMDISCCIFDKEKRILNYAGAYNSIYIVRDEGATPIEAPRMKTITHEGKTLYELLADRQPIGVFIKEKPFEQQTVTLQKGDLLYMFSDGYYDQIGGKAERKLMSRNFKRILLDISMVPIQVQREVLASYLSDWMLPRHKQIDDILVMGIAIE